MIWQQIMDSPLLVKIVIFILVALPLSVLCNYLQYKLNLWLERREKKKEKGV